MELSKYRYFGRFIGLIDALGMKECKLSPDDYYKLPKERMVLYSARGIGKYNCQELAKKLQELSGNASLPPPSKKEEQEFKIGLREGMRAVWDNNNNSMK